jgi:hypothetical protein
MKTCSRCKESKPLDHFPSHKGKKDGLGCYCRGCHKEQKAASYRRTGNQEKFSKASREYYAKNQEAQRRRYRVYYAKNKQKMRDRAKKYRDENYEAVCASRRSSSIKMRSTPKGKISVRMSKRIRDSLCRSPKAGRHWQTLVGFTLEQLQAHLEKQFTPEMTWENYGTHWHIDHKIPIAVFNFETTDDIDFKRCWSLQNLQPLEAIENMSKGMKVKRPFQPSLTLAVPCLRGQINGMV